MSAEFSTLSPVGWRALSVLALFWAAMGAQAVTIDATARGVYGSHGTQNPPEDLSYLTGYAGGGDLLNSFFIFDLRAVSGTITGGVLRLRNPGVGEHSGYLSPDPTETFEVHHVATPASSLLAWGNGVAKFVDLADGPIYGSYTASAADNGAFVEVTMNATAIADIQSAIGGLFAVGGTLSTRGSGAREYLFGWTNDDVLGDTQLVLSTVRAIPEPGTLVLFAAGVAALLARRGKGKCLMDIAKGMLHRTPAISAPGVQNTPGKA